MAGVIGRAFGMDPIAVLGEPVPYRRVLRVAAFWGAERLYAEWRREHERGGA